MSDTYPNGAASPANEVRSTLSKAQALHAEYEACTQPLSRVVLPFMDECGTEKPSSELVAVLNLAKGVPSIPNK